MNKIIMKRGAGKTTELIKMSAETGAYIVCHNYAEAHRIAEYARNLDCNIPFPICYHDVLEGRMRTAHRDVVYLLDNADRFLEMVFNDCTSNDKLKAITITDDKTEL